MSEFDLFLQHCPPDLAPAAEAARALILEVMPDAVEQFDLSASLIAYGTDRTTRGLVCGIIYYSAHLNLIFARGAHLPDPQGLLQGSGKHARHIRIQRVEDVHLPAVLSLCEQAVHLKNDH